MSLLKALTLILVGAKLFGYFAYSWWLVFAPLFLEWTIFWMLLILSIWLESKKSPLERYLEGRRK